MAISAVFSNKLRSFLTMLGIIIGVMAVTLLVSLVQGATGKITDSMSGLGGDQIIVTITNRQKRLNYTELKALEGTGDVDKVSPYLNGNGTATAGNSSADVSIYGITAAYQDVQGLDLEYGRNISEFDREEALSVCIVGYDTAVDLYNTANAVGQTIRINGMNYRIIGVLEKEDSTMMNSTGSSVYLPLSNAQRLLRQAGITTFYVTAQDTDSLSEAQDTTDSFLKTKFGDEDSYTVLNMSSIMDIIDTVLGTLSLMLGGIAAISLLVGGIGIMNIMLVSVTERTKEIGIRKAIGAQRSDIIVQFLMESIIISLIGGLLGMALSQLVLSILNVIFTDYHFVISASVGALALGFSVGVGVIFGIYPANKAAGLKPINALRFE